MIASRDLHTSATSVALEPPVVKHYTRGTHRVGAPAATLRWIRTHASSMGITRVANITGLDELELPVAAAYRPNSRGLSVSQGKGLDLEAAKVSALMESIEGYHAERICHPLIVDSYDALRARRRVVRVEELPRVQGSLFHGGLRILWIEAQCAADGAAVLVPYEIVHTDYTLPLPEGSGCFQASSNGLAAGNHPLEALSHGICELVERDATAVWWAHCAEERATRRLDLRTVNDEHCMAVLEQYASHGMTVAAWETTTEIELPCFFCVIGPRSASAGDHLLVADGMGCHPSRGVALLRALLEAAQSRLTVITGARDDLTWRTYLSAESRSHAARLRAMLVEGSDARGFYDGPECTGATLDEDVRNELRMLHLAGFDEVLAIDLTRAELGIPVVRVTVPGLEGVCFQPGYVPGERVRALLRRS